MDTVGEKDHPEAAFVRKDRLAPDGGRYFDRDRRWLTHVLNRGTPNTPQKNPVTNSPPTLTCCSARPANECRSDWQAANSACNAST